MTATMAFHGRPTIVQETKSKVFHVPPKPAALPMQTEELPEAMSYPGQRFAGAIPARSPTSMRQAPVVDPCAAVYEPVSADHSSEAAAWAQLRKFVHVIADTAMSSRRTMVQSCDEHIDRLQEQLGRGSEAVVAEKVRLEAELARSRELALGTEAQLRLCVEAKEGLAAKLQQAEQQLQGEEELRTKMQGDMQKVCVQIESLQSELLVAQGALQQNEGYRSLLEQKNQELATGNETCLRLQAQLRTVQEELLQERTGSGSLRVQVETLTHAMTAAEKDAATQRTSYAEQEQRLLTEQETILQLQRRLATLEAAANGCPQGQPPVADTYAEKLLWDELSCMHSEQLAFEEAAQRAARRCAEVQHRLTADPSNLSGLPRATSFPGAWAEARTSEMLQPPPGRAFVPPTEAQVKSPRAPAPQPVVVTAVASLPFASQSPGTTTDHDWDNVSAMRSSSRSEEGSGPERHCQPFVCTTYASLSQIQAHAAGQIGFGRPIDTASVAKQSSAAVPHRS
mmetsp:Transcript_38113/g.89310  ORF Transcript_38113/g.89310 Transcript_38113/m.89310 type:complete len:511 (+) Transcript_38113:56-1588(+)